MAGDVTALAAPRHDGPRRLPSCALERARWLPCREAIAADDADFRASFARASTPRGRRGAGEGTDPGPPRAGGRVAVEHARGRRDRRLHRPPGRGSREHLDPGRVRALRRQGRTRAARSSSRASACSGSDLDRLDETARHPARPRRGRRRAAVLRPRPPGPRRGDVLAAVRRLRPGPEEAEAGGPVREFIVGRARRSVAAGAIVGERDRHRARPARAHPGPGRAGERRLARDVEGVRRPPLGPRAERHARRTRPVALEAALTAVTPLSRRT